MSGYPNYELLLEEVKKFVVSFYRNHPDDRLFYHNLQHTQSVVKAAAQIAAHFQLNEADLFTVLTAAWFHDCGYRHGGPSNHEEKSALIAADFLRDCNLDEKILDNITDCILATKLPQKPATLPESIVCDADLFHLGSGNFASKSKLLRKEVNALSGSKTGKKEWRQKTLAFLKEHEYHTDFCRLLLDAKKEENIKKLAGAENPAQEDVIIPENNTGSPGSEPIFKEEANGEKVLKGIDTMFKITSNNQQRLSNMADSKAHIMISVNAVIISLVISLILRQMEKYPKMVIPAIMLLVVNLVTIVFAILATRPVLPSGRFTPEDVKTKNVNLLFFGNFYKMLFDEYMSGMTKIMNDKEFLYESLARDVYGQGIVLGRKYRLLRTAYNVFMFGLILSVVAFVIAALS
jgi:predicted metal-dependent HD superfamily phosphohydrolase